MSTQFKTIYVSASGQKECIVKENCEWREFIVECFMNGSMVDYFQFDNKNSAIEQAQMFGSV